MGSSPTIYLIRHGETEWNRIKRLQGWLDSPLTETGKAQARIMAGILNTEISDFAHINFYCSPLGRARQTADIICAELGWNFADCKIEDAIKEVNTGDWDGMSYVQIAEAFPEELDRFQTDGWKNAPPGGESYAMLAKRISTWLDGLPISKATVAVSHGIAGQVIRGLYLGLSEDQTVRLDQPQDVIYLLKDGRAVELADN